MTVFTLEHVHILDCGTEDVKFIGVYSTREKAQAALMRTHLLPGFAAAPDGFSIGKYEVDKDYWNTGFVAWFKAG